MCFLEHCLISLKLEFYIFTFKAYFSIAYEYVFLLLRHSIGSNVNLADILGTQGQIQKAWSWANRRRVGCEVGVPFSPGKGSEEEVGPPSPDK